MTDYIFGCDVSGYQSSTLVPWADPRIGFGIVKFSEAGSAATSTKLHCAALRGANKPMAGYHFFHPECDVRAQFEAFDNVAASVGYGNGNPLDVVPALDIECFAGHGVTPAWNEPLEQLAAMFSDAFAMPLLYLNASTWAALGKPTWILDYPLWVAMYAIDGAVPRDTLPSKFVPGNGDWTIWQRYVGPLFGTVQNTKARGAVDQNWAKTLPMIGEK